MKQAFAILFTLILCLTHATAQSVVTTPLRQDPPLRVIAETVTVIGTASTLTITTPEEYYLQVTDGGQCAVTA